METPETQKLLLQHVRQLAAEVAELKLEGDAPLTDNIAHWMAALYLVAAKTEAREAEGGCIDLKTLSALNADLVALRHGDHCAERLKVERERLELEIKKFQFDSARMARDYAKEIKLICADRSLGEKEMIQKISFLLFGNPPENMQGLYNVTRLTQEEQNKRIREILKK